MKIFIRVDSSNTIGLGHTMRSLLLANRLKTYDSLIEIIFLTQNLYGNINEKIIECNFSLINLKNNDIFELIEIMKKNKVDLLIVDSYEITYAEEQLLNNLNIKTLFFDDLFLPHCSNMILNHGLHVVRDDYKNLLPKSTKIFCGSEYTLLRNEFFVDYNFKDENIVSVILGGNDVYNLSLIVLKLLKRVDEKFILNIITTSVNPNLEELKKQDFYNLYLDVDNVAEILAKSTFVVCASGGNLFEVIALKKAFINIQVASNQDSIVKYLEGREIFTTINKENLSFQNIKEKIEYIKSNDIYKKLDLNFSKTKLVKEIMKEIK